MGSPLLPWRATGLTVRTSSTSAPVRFAASFADRGPPILRGLGLARLQGCRFDDCDEIARALVDDENQNTIAGQRADILGVSAFWRGDLAKARHYLGDAIETYDVSRRDEHLGCTPRTRRLFASYGWPSSSFGQEMPAGPTRQLDPHSRSPSISII